MSGVFAGDFGVDFDIAAGTGLVELVIDLSVDDHPRPDHPLWRRYGYPNTQAGLLLYKDGRVQPVAFFDLAATLAADDFVAGGHRVILEPGSWQAAVLVAAGYQLVPVPDPVPQGIGGRPYGEGIYGFGIYGSTP